MKKIWGYWYTLLFIIEFGFLGGSGSIEGAPLYTQIATIIVVISMFGFFILMLADFLSNKDVKHRLIVGFSLIFFNLIAILIYFWLVVNRRSKI